MVPVRFCIEPAFCRTKQFGQILGRVPSHKNGVGHLYIGKTVIGNDQIAASAGNRLKRNVIFRCGKDIFALNMQTEISRTNPVIGEKSHANTTPFRIVNWLAVSMTSLVSCRMSSVE